MRPILMEKYMSTVSDLDPFRCMCESRENQASTSLENDLVPNGIPIAKHEDN